MLIIFYLIKIHIFVCSICRISSLLCISLLLGYLRKFDIVALLQKETRLQIEIIAFYQFYLKRTILAEKY